MKNVKARNGDLKRSLETEMRGDPERSEWNEGDLVPVQATAIV